ncbi:MAG: pirin family protein [Saprospiraceae bacterium]|nr:pirin family protein [Saprospiraceae bacterium]
MRVKSVESIVSPPSPHFVGDGFRVHNFIPSVGSLSRERMDPFVMLDYNSKFYFGPSATPKGVGVHPHRGFETVTIAYQGKVEHHDSSGGGGIIGEGDVQWMTAASGVLHKEFHEKEWSKNGGIFQMVQLWVNLPAKDKRASPKYQSIENKKMGKWQLPDNSVFVDIIAGELHGIKGAADTFTPMHMYNVKMIKGGICDLSFPKHYNTALLVIEGSISVNSTHEALTDHFVLMANDGENFHIEATEETKILVMSGEPIREPIVSYGPFVMNTEEELQQAYEDFRNGKFGHLAD